MLTFPNVAAFLQIATFTNCMHQYIYACSRNNCLPYTVNLVKLSVVYPAPS